MIPFIFQILPRNILVATNRRHRLAGTVTVDGVPARRRVIAVDRRNLFFLGATWSDAITGAWELIGLEDVAERNVLVIALDTTGNYNAEVADYITQVATVTP